METEGSVKVEPNDWQPTTIPSIAEKICCPEKKASSRNLLFVHFFSRLGPDSGSCLVCGKQLACNQGTTGLRRHLEAYHKDKWEDYLERKASRDKARLSSTPRLTKSGPARMQTSRGSKSLLWGNFFERVGDSKAKCHRCECELQATDGNTTGLSRHLQAKHRLDWQRYCQQRGERNEGREAGKAIRKLDGQV